MGASDFGWSSLILEDARPRSPRPRQLPGGQLVGAAKIPGRSGVPSCRRHDPAGRDSDAGIPEALDGQRMRQKGSSASALCRVGGRGDRDRPGIGFDPRPLGARQPRMAGARRVLPSGVRTLLRRLVSCGLRSADGAEGELPRSACQRWGANALAPAGGASGLAIGDWVLHLRRQGRGRGWSSAPLEFFVFTSAFNVGAVAVLGWLGAVRPHPSSSGVFYPGARAQFPVNGCLIAVALALDTAARRA